MTFVAGISAVISPKNAVSVAWNIYVVERLRNLHVLARKIGNFTIL